MPRSRWEGTAKAPRAAERAPNTAWAEPTDARVRPRSEAELPFRPRKAVRWFSPGVLARSGLRVVLSSVFGVFLDKRELQAALDAHPLDGYADENEMWIDYVSDTGDGFHATYAIAWLAGQRELEVRGLDHRLQRGSMLVLGGDEVYPVGDATEYEDRFVGPYQSAFPGPPNGRHELVALPGNHDWYDGLTSFMRIFGQGKSVGGWKTRQRRSYFAVPLPHHWWLLGIDIQLDTYIDEPQLQYFRGVVEAMEEGSPVILCTAKPSWVDTRADPEAYRNLAYFERKVIRPRGKVMLTLTGDSHHYARYEDGAGAHKITSGGGGAFLHPTHDLPEEVSISVEDTEPPQTYVLRKCYPDRETSGRSALGAVGLPFANPSFMYVPAVVHVLLLWANQFGIRSLEESSRRPLAEAAPNFGLRDLALGLVRNPISVVLLLTFLAALVAFAKPPAAWQRNPRRIVAKMVMGTVHWALQVLTVLLVALASIRLASWLADGAWFVVLLFLLVAVLGGVASGVAMGLYLAASASFLDAHGNEAFSSMRLTTYKNFLRIHINSDGQLILYPIGVRRVPKRWRFDPTPGAPWYAPADGAPAPVLLEEPILVDGRAQS